MDPDPWPGQSKHLAWPQVSPEGSGETQSLQSGILFKHWKKPPSFTPPEHRRENQCDNPGVAGGVTFLSVENEIVWMSPPLRRSLFNL